jgi:hypothetical protein
MKNKNVSDVENLYNCRVHKTKRVISYIKSLDIDMKWSIRKRNLFYKRIREILSGHTASQMLDMIGYEYNSQPKIYSEINNIDD